MQQIIELKTVAGRKTTGYLIVNTDDIGAVKQAIKAVTSNRDYPDSEELMIAVSNQYTLNFTYIPCYDTETAFIG